MPTNAQAGGAFDPGRALVISGQIVNSGPRNSDGGIGYTTGAGATVTQQTNRTTAVTINALCGTITTNNASLAAEAAASFTVNNNCVSATDTILLTQKGGAVGVMTDAIVIAVANGSFNIAVLNNNVAAGTAETGAIAINFAVIKGSSS